MDVTPDARKLVSVEQKTAIRSLLDGSWNAIEAEIRDAVEDPKDAEAIIEAIRQNITAERALADDDIRPLDDAELLKRVTEGG